MISLLCVCVNYADYLEETLKYNHSIFNNIFIITIPQDHQTKQIIDNYNNVQYIETEIFYENNCAFNKGAGLNLGLQFIKQHTATEWLVIGDADCIYPRSLKEYIDQNILNKNYIYGMRREIVNSSKVLNDIMSGKYKPTPRLEKNMRHIPGYFQLINLNADKFIQKINYPEFPTAQRSDRFFARDNFAPNERSIIDNDFVIHLGPTTINWSGRKSGVWE